MSMRNTKGDRFPEVRVRSVWVEFLIGFFSGIASAVVVNNTPTATSMASAYIATSIVKLLLLLAYAVPPGTLAEPTNKGPEGIFGPLSLWKGRGLDCKRLCRIVADCACLL